MIYWLNKTSEFFVDKNKLKHKILILKTHSQSWWTIPFRQIQNRKESEKSCVYLLETRSFDSLNLVLKMDKIKRMKLVSNNHFPLVTRTNYIFLQRSYLSRIGGWQHRVVGNVFKKVMRYSLATHFCLKGQSDFKTRFDKTDIMDVVVCRSHLM